MSLEIKKRTTLPTRTIQQFRDIYIQSFPPSERIDIDALIHAIHHHTRWFYGAYVKNDLVALAVMLPLKGSDIILLEYLAVHESRRGEGIGTALLKEIKLQLQSQEARGIILEVESVDKARSESEKQERERRIRFYQRLGATIVRCAPHYQMPDMEQEKHSVPMQLMWIPLQLQTKELTGTQLKSCIKNILVQSYGCSNDDPLLVENLRRVTC